MNKKNSSTAQKAVQENSGEVAQEANSCCGSLRRTTGQLERRDPSSVHKAVQEHYGKWAEENDTCCGQAGGADEKLDNILYPQELLAGLPTDIANFTAGSGDPISVAGLKPGEVVLDLGSGGGLDCYLAARQVGATGHVIGVDMTPEMIRRARASAERLAVRNVEFREGYLEDLPVEASSVDVVVSNCVINLSPDKLRVFAEVFRVLKPGGRLSVSDIVTNRPLSADKRADREEWCGCVAGALSHKEYVDALTGAGFVDIRVSPNIEMIEKAMESGLARVESNKKLSNEEILEHIRNWDNLEGYMFTPHTITARKPA